MMKYDDAMVYAVDLVHVLMPVCSRVAIAGSLRRRRAEVKDIEIVCIARQAQDLFGMGYMDDYAIREVLEERGVTALKNGSKYKMVDVDGVIRMDLFITTPEQWGVIFAIRTGNRFFSHHLVTQRSCGGWLPSNLRVKDGRVWDGDVALDTPEEEDFLDLVGIGWVAPEDREVEYAWRVGI